MNGRPSLSDKAKSPKHPFIKINPNLRLLTFNISGRATDQAYTNNREKWTASRTAAGHGSARSESLMRRILNKFIADKGGATAIEYSLIAGFIGLVIVGGLTTVGTKVSAKFQAVASGLN
jgi:pilus assembly protein Flp/PilA